MKICLSPVDEFIRIPPNQIIYTLSLKDDDLQNELLCDVCWTNKYEYYDHHWFKHSSGKISVLSMTFGEFIDKITKEHGINMFDDLRRLEFINKWINYNKEYFNNILDETQNHIYQNDNDDLKMSM